MDRNEIYSEILRQSAEESRLGRGLEAAAGDDVDHEGVADDAERLADVLYRLCLEFGLPFNEFRSDVLQAALDTTRIRARTQRDDARPVAAFLAPVSDDLPVLIFALELMPEDSDY